MRSLQMAIVASCALALTACAMSSTQVVSSWRDPQVGAMTFHKVLVVAMVKDEVRRRSIEDRMVTDIEKYGAAAAPSYQLIPTADTRNSTAVKAAMVSGGFDGAVTWRTVGVSNETHYVPGVIADIPLGYRGFYGYYDSGWATIYDPGYLQTDKVVRVETLVYAVVPDNDRLVWMGTSETIDPSSLGNLVDGVADATIEAMRREGMFTPRSK